MKKHNNNYYDWNNKNNLFIYMSNVYGWMSLGLLLTAFISWYTTKIPFILELIFFNKFFIFILLISQLIIVLILSNYINKLTAQNAIILFIIYSILTGLSTSSIFLIYTYSSIFISFLVTSIMFAIMSIWGYITKKDLTQIGNLSLMCLVGIIISSILNLFLQNSYIIWIISYINVIIFTILTAWDTQKLKEIGNNIILKHKNQLIKYSILGALLLYLDFINIYILILRIIGVKINNKNKNKEEEN